MCVFPSHDIRFYKGDKKCLVLAWWQCNLFYSFDGLLPTVMSLIGWKISLTQRDHAPFQLKWNNVCVQSHIWTNFTSSVEGLIILEAMKKVNFVGPCWISANNDPLSVCLLTHRHIHTHNPPGLLNNDGIVKRYCAHAGIYACMCMLINTHSPTKKLKAQPEVDKKNVYYKKRTISVLPGSEFSLL